ncbi:hypothetical protein HRM2_41370 [Desulforapulum autotrophicum HRM2]|uniref:Uncharacterized protein n=1 Tax=Desulforapulum autotrophicum (strain ATCC 43914 / DSM 3382 / VKM B-1955 / HRM2) TaxID=177437 RepID=C0QCW2_DESAH|nr:hypothetical protein HRM2_41370 [Desulforapulum autotrophicum HRM2]
MWTRQHTMNPIDNYRYDGWNRSGDKFGYGSFDEIPDGLTRSNFSLSDPVTCSGSGNGQFNRRAMPVNTGHFASVSASQTVQMVPLFKEFGKPVPTAQIVRPFQD